MTDLNQAWTDAMRAGDYAAAWTINDKVLAGRDPAERDDPKLPYHLRWVWDGRPFLGRHVLIRCYHGLGDTLQFARYLPKLRPFVASLTVEVQPALLPLLAGIPGLDRLIPFRPDAPAPASECDIEIMELAHALQLPPAEAPPTWLRVTPANAVTGGTGLCWQAGDWDRERSLTAAIAAPLATRSHVILHPQAVGCPPDLAGLAEMIGALDLVITVDTMVAHLAGSLNRPTWLMLKHDADWRWMVRREDSPWYPSMRLYRQPEAGNWAPVIGRIVDDLVVSGLSPAPLRPLRTASTG
jgi:hypothetical protein